MNMRFIPAQAFPYGSSELAIPTLYIVLFCCSALVIAVTLIMVRVSGILFLVAWCFTWNVMFGLHRVLLQYRAGLNLLQRHSIWCARG